MPDYKRGRSPGSELDDEELLAELEAEIENDEDAAVRERGMQQFKQECGALFDIVQAT